MNSPSGELDKAEIRVVDGKKAGKAVACMFRPKEYTVTKQNSWQMKEVKGKDVPQLEFSGGGASTLTMELFFDTYESGKDVRKEYTNEIWGLTAIDDSLTDKINKKGRPPIVQFKWGPVISFKAVIENITQNFTMFKANGTPVRATLNVTFKEAEKPGKYPFQNPTTSSTPGYKVRTIKEGESLDWIAQEEYGDPALWRFIAETNKLEDPMKLSPGQKLSIAPAP
jgi:LysM repeat protein